MHPHLVRLRLAEFHIIWNILDRIELPVDKVLQLFLAAADAHDVMD
jgi:hypothetical protein